MLKTRKIIAIVLAAVMLIAMTACNGGSQKATTAAATAAATTAKGATTAATTAAPNTDREVFEYTWIGYAYAYPTAKDPTIKRMIEDKFDIKLTSVEIDRTNYMELINLKFASGEIPDVFAAPNAITVGQWENQGILAELKQSAIRTYAPDIAKEMDSFVEIDPNIWKYGIINGVNYGLQLLSPDTVYRAPVIWRTDWLNKLGITKLPESIDEFETALYAMANDDPDGNGIKDTFGCNATGLEAVYGTSGFLPSMWCIRDGKLVYGSVQPEMKEVLARFQKWYKDGVIDPEFVTGENQGGYWAISQPFTNGKIGMSTMGSYYHWNWPYHEGQPVTSTNAKLFSELQGPDATYEYGVPAVGANGESMMRVSSPASGITVLGMQMEGQDAKIQRMLEMQNEYAKDKDWYINCRWGEEGVLWEYDEYGTLQSLITAETPVDSKAAALGGDFNYINYNPIAFFKEIYSDQYVFAEKVCTDHRVLTACGGALASQSKYQAELDTLQSTTIIGIITGDLPIDQFDTFCADWAARGGDQLTKEANEWYNNISGVTCE